MSVFAISDLHVDYDQNRQWLAGLSTADYRDDVLIVAGDIADDSRLVTLTFRLLAARFRKVLFVPGNHDLWVTSASAGATSFEKFVQIKRIAAAEGISMGPHCDEGFSVVPLFGWYDFTFGEPDADLQSRWRDFHLCKWPDGVSAPVVADYFLGLNVEPVDRLPGVIISFSHFLPRIDVMPPDIPEQHRRLYPVLGSTRLGDHVRRLGSTIHVYGHSHVNRAVTFDGTTYVNNAFGYPTEPFTAKRLRLVFGA